MNALRLLERAADLLEDNAARLIHLGAGTEAERDVSPNAVKFARRSNFPPTTTRRALREEALAARSSA